MNKKVLIASDSTCNLSPELIEKYEIKIIPLTVILDGKEYRDGLEIDPDRIYAHYEATKQLPKTSAINIGEFSDFFKKYTDEGYDIVYIGCSLKQSSSVNTAKAVVAKMVEAGLVQKIISIDSQNASYGEGMLAIEAAKLAAYYSKAKGVKKVEVDYTKRKNVKKANGGKPGFVIYHTNYSMIIEPDISGIEVCN